MARNTGPTQSQEAASPMPVVPPEDSPAPSAHDDAAEALEAQQLAGIDKTLNPARSLIPRFNSGRRNGFNIVQQRDSAQRNLERSQAQKDLILWKLKEAVRKKQNIPQAQLDQFKYQWEQLNKTEADAEGRMTALAQVAANHAQANIRRLDKMKQAALSSHQAKGAGVLTALAGGIMLTMEKLQEFEHNRMYGTKDNETSLRGSTGRATVKEQRDARKIRLQVKGY